MPWPLGLVGTGRIWSVGDRKGWLTSGIFWHESSSCIMSCKLTVRLWLLCGFSCDVLWRRLKTLGEVFPLFLIPGLKSVSSGTVSCEERRVEGTGLSSGDWSTGLLVLADVDSFVVVVFSNCHFGNFARTPLLQEINKRKHKSFFREKKNHLIYRPRFHNSVRKNLA